MDILKTKKIYMIGIKGVGMTMLAQYLAGQGIVVSGSDTPEKFMTDKILKNSNIEVIEKFDTANIPADADLIVYSTAYNKNNPEVAAAYEGKIPVMTYAQALGEVFNQKFGIAVAGSHGKTTTTAWLGYILEKSGFKPNVLVGAYVPQFAGAGLIGHSHYFIIEADEYQNKFKYFNPQAIILNNIDYDHPDFFPSADEYRQAFVEFIAQVPKQGFLVANFDDKIIRQIANVNCRAKVISYALNDTADYIAYDIKRDSDRQYFKVKFGIDEATDDPILSDSLLGDFSIQLLGKHNIYNALAVIAVCIELNVPLASIRKYLEDFTGTERRMQILGDYNGALIIDDYAHHPTEIKATLAALKEKYPKKNLIVVFHPHTFSRTRALFEEFVNSFAKADSIIILDIYGSAREKQGGISSSELVEKIKMGSPEKIVKHLPHLQDAENYLKKKATNSDIIILMGAGDVFRIGQNLIKY